ncbi:reverse transcriptase domain-containing protein [Tanacetum coccineum]
MDNKISFPFVSRCRLVDSPIILKALIEGFQFQRIYLDKGSSSKFMYGHCFRNLGSDTKAKLRESRVSLVELWGEVNYPLGVIGLNVTIGELDRLRTVTMEFVVVKCHSPYNIILGRMGMRSLGAAQGPASEGRITHPQIRASEPNEILEEEGTESPERQSLKEKHNEEAELPLPPEVGTTPDEKDEEDKSTEAPKERKPPERVTINGNHSDQPITIEGNLSTECRTVDKSLTQACRCLRMEKAEHNSRQKEGGQRRSGGMAQVRNSKEEIDWKIKSLIGFKYKCFLDAYKGYHQIQMSKKDEEKTALHTDEGVFCYTKMPFRLKNAGATYQRDDMVIKSKTELDLIKDIEETLLTLKKVNMKLNPKKCSFKIEEGKFLGYIVTSEGIRANPTKKKAVRSMPSPNNLKQMQSLSGKLAALNRFMSKAAERVIPCLDTLKKCMNKDFHCTKAAEEAFQTMKKLIVELPTLTALMKDEELMMYLSAANEAVNDVLLVERNGKQMPIHYVSRSLHGAEVNYAPMGKLALALVREASGRLAKWAVELGAYGIKYVPKNAIKGQVLADFLADTGPKRNEQTDAIPINEAVTWKLYTDGASNDHGSGAGLILIDSEGVEYSYTLRLNFNNSNNDAEYEALLENSGWGED